MTIQEIETFISNQVVPLLITYEGLDENNNLKFRMPPGSPLLTQTESIMWCRKIYNEIMQSPSIEVCDFVNMALNFKLIAP